MNQYVVEITDEALVDMEQLYNYIAFVLLSPENAMGQYNRIADEILKLDVLKPMGFHMFRQVQLGKFCMG